MWNLGKDTQVMLLKDDENFYCSKPSFTQWSSMTLNQELFVRTCSDVAAGALLIYFGFGSKVFEMQVITIIAALVIKIRAIIGILSYAFHIGKKKPFYLVSTLFSVGAVVMVCGAAAYFKDKWTFGAALIIGLLQFENYRLCRGKNNKLRSPGNEDPCNYHSHLNIQQQDGTKHWIPCSANGSFERSSKLSGVLNTISSLHREEEPLICGHFFLDEDDDIMYAGENSEELGDSDQISTNCNTRTDTLCSTTDASVTTSTFRYCDIDELETKQVVSSIFQ